MTRTSKPIDKMYESWTPEAPPVSAPRIVAECWTCDRMPIPQIQNSDTPQHLSAARHIAFGHDVRPVRAKGE